MAGGLIAIFCFFFDCNRNPRLSRKLRFEIICR